MSDSSNAPSSFRMSLSRCLAVVCLFLILACRVSDSPGDEYLVFRLSETLKQYDRVSIKLVNPKDSNEVYDSVWNDKIPEPSKFPKFRLRNAKGKDFSIQVRAFNAKGDLQFAKNVMVNDAVPMAPEVVRSDVRLIGLSSNSGELVPDFSPDVKEYSFRVADSVDVAMVKALPIDPAATLTINGNAHLWGTEIPVGLQPGNNRIQIHVNGKDGAAGSYTLTIHRDTVPSDTEAPTVTAGAEITVKTAVEVDFPITVTAKSGTITSLSYDLEGDGQWDNADSLVIPASVKHTYAVAKQYQAKFLVRDSKGKSGRTTRIVTVTDSIVAPPVPGAPKVSGATPTNTAPAWSWISGGNGTGAYRFKLDNDDMETGATETQALTWTFAGTPVSGSTYTLYVQERSSVGIWSPSGSKALLFDASKPMVSITAPLASGTYVTKAATVSVNGKASAASAIAKLSYTFGAGAEAPLSLASGAWSIADLPLTDGIASLLTITVLDAAGNSGTATLTLQRDNTPPGAPSLISPPASPTKADKAAWNWTKGADGTAAAPGSGLSGNYRYSLDGGVTWKDTLTATSIADVPLIEGTNTFDVQEEDLAGNWSASASGSVTSDRTAPVLTITSPATAASTLASATLTVSGKATDAGTSVASVTVTGQSAGSEAAVLTSGTWNAPGLTLVSGLNTLVVTATDAVGNPTSSTLKVTVSVAVPEVTIVSPANNFVTNEASITVTFKVDNGNNQTQVYPLPVEGVNTLKVTSEPNELGVSGTKSVVVVKDATAPNPPTLSATRLLTNVAPVLDISAGTDNAGGGGMPAPPVYRYRVGSGAFTTIGTSTITLPATEGSFTVVVQGQDKAGNWSANSNAVTVRVDKTLPVVTLTSPANGYITNQGTVSVAYTSSDGSGTVSRTLSNDNGVANSITVSVTDSAGNTGTSPAITVYRRSNVLFVKSGGSGNGSSWDTALGSLATALSTATSGKEIWVSGEAFPAGSGSFTLKSGVSLYGGFSAAGTAKAIGDRTFGPADTTTLSRTGTGSLLIYNGTGVNAFIDGFKFSVTEGVVGVDMTNSSQMTIRKCLFAGPAMLAATGTAVKAYNSSLILESSTITRFWNSDYVVDASGATGSVLTLSGCVFSGNLSPSPTSGALGTRVHLAGNKPDVINCKFQDRHAYAGYPYIVYASYGGTGDRIKVSGTNFNFTPATPPDPAPDLTSVIDASGGVIEDGGGNTYQ